MINESSALPQSCAQSSEVSSEAVRLQVRGVRAGEGHSSPLLESDEVVSSSDNFAQLCSAAIDRGQYWMNAFGQLIQYPKSVQKLVLILH